MTIGAAIFLSPKSETSTKACDDLSCLFNSSRFKAGDVCRDAVERRAKYNVEWTNWAVDGIFTRYGWLNKAERTIILAGDKVKFQNGFGAWSIMNYQCDYDPARKTLLAVRVNEGRLPEIGTK